MIASVGHFELPARDPQRAAAFYRRAFGWRLEPLEEEGGWDGPAYFKVRTPAPQRPSSSALHGAIQGGLSTPEVMGAEQPLLVIHLEGEGLAACLARITEAGGTVAAAPAAVGEMGFFARFRDPEGNLLGLWAGEP